MKFDWSQRDGVGCQPSELGYHYDLCVAKCDGDSDEWTWRVFVDDMTRLQGPRFWSADRARLDCERVVAALAPLLLAEADAAFFGDGERPAWFGEKP